MPKPRPVNLLTLGSLLVLSMCLRMEVLAMTQAVFEGMQSLRKGYRALVIGASRGLGQAFTQVLQSDPGCEGVQAVYAVSRVTGT
jgi:NADPH:quinone reductase-like Zn-dependent oxidoreductase